MTKTAERAIASMSESTRRLNPHLSGAKTWSAGTKPTVEILRTESAGNRLRQDSKPLMNKLECDWFSYLNAMFGGKEKTLRAQAKRYKLANGAWYKPDITATINGRETAWECKGPKQMKSMARAMLVIKVAAAQWPEVNFVLVWREGGRWFKQEVLP